MKPATLINLLFLSLLIHEAQGRARKLMITSDPFPTIAKNENDKNKEKSATKEENLSVNSSSSTAEQRRPAAAAAGETYPDILDLAGMDYSQARRKPPIHN